MGSDHFVAVHLPLAQHPDLLRAGVGKQGGMSLMAGVPVGDAHDRRHLAAAGAGRVRDAGERALAVGARRHEGARWRSTAGRTRPNGAEGIVASVAVDPAALEGRRRRPARDPRRLRALVRRGRARDHLRHPGPGGPALPQRCRDRAAGRDRLTSIEAAVGRPRTGRRAARPGGPHGGSHEGARTGPRHGPGQDDPRFAECGPRRRGASGSCTRPTSSARSTSGPTGPNGVLVLEVPDLAAAREAIDSLPLVAAGLIDFDLVPLKPYPGFARLFAEAATGLSAGRLRAPIGEAAPATRGRRRGSARPGAGPGRVSSGLEVAEDGARTLRPRRGSAARRSPGR